MNKQRINPFYQELPADICFRKAVMEGDAIYPKHSHSGGEFVYSFNGLMEVMLTDQQYLAPRHYGIWLPPNVEHSSVSRNKSSHCSVYVAPRLCEKLPKTTCAIAVSSFTRSILEHLWQNPPDEQPSEEDERLLMVLIDQLGQAETVKNYLPVSHDPLLEPILEALEENPGDYRSLAQFAQEAGTTERTLIRRCHRDLGMSFAEWKQRLKAVKAMELLEKNKTIEQIALALGYGSSSAFITMFKRLIGVTPAEFKKRLSSN